MGQLSKSEQVIRTRICLLLPTLRIGGAQQVMILLAEFLSKKNYDVTLLVINAEGPMRERISDGYKLVDLATQRLRYSPLKLGAYLKRNKFDVIISGLRTCNIILSITCLFSNKNKNQKIIFREATTLDNIKSKSKFYQYLYLFVLKMCYARAHKIVANSTRTMMDLIDNAVCERKSVVSIPNPVVIGTIPKVSKREVRQNTLKLVTVGRLHEVKNHSFLIDCMSKHGTSLNCTLDIFGDGHLKPKLRKQIEDNGLENHVFLRGYENKVLQRLQDYDVFVLSSHWEGFGNAVVEALAAGLPIVARDVPGGLQKIITNDRLGYLSAKNEIDDFWEYIKKAHASSNLHFDYRRKHAYEKYSVENYWSLLKSYIND